MICVSGAYYRNPTISSGLSMRVMIGRAGVCGHHPYGLSCESIKTCLLNGSLCSPSGFLWEPSGLQPLEPDAASVLCEEWKHRLGWVVPSAFATFVLWRTHATSFAVLCTQDVGLTKLDLDTECSKPPGKRLGSWRSWRECWGVQICLTQKFYNGRWL